MVSLEFVLIYFIFPLGTLQEESIDIRSTVCDAYKYYAREEPQVLPERLKQDCSEQPLRPRLLEREPVVATFFQ